MEQKDNSHKQWAGEKKPSMKRRSDQNDYTERGIYLVTIAIEGRKPLLGTLAGRIDVQEGPDSPHVELSSWGERVRACWMAIPEYHHEIECMKLCIMPDHIHGILFVHEKMDCHLGHVIRGFKTGTRKAARELGLLPTAQFAQPTERPQQAPQHQQTPPPQQGAPSSHVPYAAQFAQQQQLPSRHTAAARAHGILWEPGYHDRLLLHKNQLAHMLAYLDDNPRRLLLKRKHAEYFIRLAPITIVGVEMQAMGNSALLSYGTKMERLQCSRHLYQQEIDQEKEKFLTLGLAGTTIISACISSGEQQIATACIKAGIPFIVLLVHGFPPFYKPAPLYLQACAEGRLLLISPFQWQNEKITNMRQRCLYLNDLALHIANEVNKRA